jgi:hypothetical protein
MRAAIHIVAKEEVVGLGREATILKQAQEVVVLSVDVAWNTPLAMPGETINHQHTRPQTAYFYWSFEVEQSGLSQEDLAGLVNQTANLGLGQVDMLAELASLDCEE